MWVVVGICIVLFIVGFLIVGVYNQLVALYNRANNAFAQIDVQLKRRYDLILISLKLLKNIYPTKSKRFLKSLRQEITLKVFLMRLIKRV